MNDDPKRPVLPDAGVLRPAIVSHKDLVRVVHHMVDRRLRDLSPTHSEPRVREEMRARIAASPIFVLEMVARRSASVRSGFTLVVRSSQPASRPDTENLARPGRRW